jgi:hypothetical protein
MSDAITASGLQPIQQVKPTIEYLGGTSSYRNSPGMLKEPAGPPRAKNTSRLCSIRKAANTGVRGVRLNGSIACRQMEHDTAGPSSGLNVAVGGRNAEEA